MGFTLSAGALALMEETICMFTSVLMLSCWQVVVVFKWVFVSKSNTDLVKMCVW